MSQSLEVVRRLEAWHAGKPMKRGDVINVHVADDDDIQIIAFLRMGGESRPWGIATGTISTGPMFHVVPEGRDRTSVGDMVAAWAPSLLEFFRHSNYSDERPDASTNEPIRQVWFPGDSHVEMLQHIAAAYARTKWERDDVDTLRAIGNLANCLFIESQRPGQQIVQSATTALRTAYVFPTATVRQGHLGHLVAWLRKNSSREALLKSAMEAEKNSVATVVNPDVERTVLAPLLTKWNEARKAGDERAMADAADTLQAAMTQELSRRWNLTKDAIEALRNDRRLPNAGLVKLCEESIKSFHHNWGKKVLNEVAGNPAYWPNVFTDYAPRTAGAEYQQRVIDDGRTRSLLLHGDKQLQQEELAKGRAMICTIVDIEDATAAWTLQLTYPTLPTCKVGDKMAIAGAPTCQLEVRDIDDEGGTLEVRPTWKRDKKELGSLGKAPSNPQWRGKSIVLVGSSFDSFDKVLKARKRKEDGNDITDLIVSRPRRHGAFTDDGVAIEVGEEA